MKVPRYEDKVNLDVPNVAMPSIPIPPQAAFGGLEAQAIENMGAKLGEIAGMVQKRAQERQDADNDLQAQKVFDEYLLDSGKKLTSSDMETVEVGGNTVERQVGLLNRKGDLSKDTTKEFVDWHFENKEKYLSKIADPRLRSKIDEMMGNSYVSSFNLVNRNEADEWQRNLNSRYKASMELQIADAPRSQTPEDIKRGLKNLITTSMSYDQHNGLPVEAATVNAQKNAKDFMVQSTVGAIQAGVPEDKVMALLDSVHGEGMNVINDGDYNEIKTKISDTYQAIQKEQRVQAKELMIKTRFDTLENVFNGKFDWSNSDKLISTLGSSDHDLGKALKNIVLYKGAILPPSDSPVAIANWQTSLSLGRDILKSENPEDITNYFIGSMTKDNGQPVGLNDLQVLFSLAKERADVVSQKANPQVVEDHSITKSAMDFFKSVSPMYQAGKLFMNFLRAKQDNKLHGDQLRREMKNTVRQEVINQNPEVAPLKLIPNKIIREDGPVEPVYEGPMELKGYGDDDVRADFTQDDGQ